MKTLEAIQNRRAVKHFDPEYQMSEESIKELLKLALLSPTAFNIQHWRFLLVCDPQLRQEIRAAAWNQAQVTESSLLIILCANLDAWKDRPERYWANAPKPVQEFMLPAIHNYYEGKPQIMRDEAMRSCGIAGQTIMLAAKAMGLDSCPMDGFDFEKVGELIHLPANHLISFMIAIGKPMEPARPRGGELPYEEVVKINSF